MREFALEAYFARWEGAVRHNLAASECEPLRLPDLLALADDEARSRWESLRLGYGDPAGAIWLRTAIAGLYDTVGPEDVLCFAGAQEGIHCAMHTLLGPGDHAIVVTPNYQSAETIPLALGAVTGVALDPARGWTLDIDEVAAAIRPNTRLVSINFPNNPTGKILERDRFDALVALCRQHGLWLFSDEVYRLIERDPADRLPQLADIYERGLSLNVMSKAYGLPGLRIGWIACRDAAVLHRMGQLKHYLSICNAAPSEVLASIALRASDTILSRNRDIAAHNLARVENGVRRVPHPARLAPARGRHHLLPPLSRSRGGRGVRGATDDRGRRVGPAGQRLPVRPGGLPARPFPLRLRPVGDGGRPDRHAAPSGAPRRVSFAQAEPRARQARAIRKGDGVDEVYGR